MKNAKNQTKAEARAEANALLFVAQSALLDARYALMPFEPEVAKEITAIARKVGRHRTSKKDRAAS